MPLPMTAEVLVPLGAGILVVIVAVAVLLRALRRRLDAEESRSPVDRTGEGVEAPGSAETHPAGDVSVAETIAIRESVTEPMPVMPPEPPRSFPPLTEELSPGRTRGGADRPPAVPVARRGRDTRVEPQIVPLQRQDSARPVASDPATDGCPVVSPASSDQERAGAGAATPSGRDGASDPAPPPPLPRRVARRSFPGTTAPFEPAPGSDPAPAADAAAEAVDGAGSADGRPPGRIPAATAADRVAAARAVAGREAAERAAADRGAGPGTPSDTMASGAGTAPSLFEHPVPWQRAPDQGWASSQRPAAASPDDPRGDRGALHPTPGPTTTTASDRGADEVGSGRPVAAAVAHALAARAAAADPAAADRTAADPASAPTDVATGDARDRLLAALLDDPVRAVAAVTELAAGRDQLSRLQDAAEARRSRLGAALEVLARSGLSPTQLARLSGLGDSEIRALLPSLLA